MKKTKPVNLNEVKIHDGHLNKEGYYETIKIWMDNSGGDKEVLKHGDLLKALRDEKWEFKEKGRKTIRFGKKVYASFSVRPPSAKVMHEQLNKPVEDVVRIITLSYTVKEFAKEFVHDYSLYYYWCIEKGLAPISLSKFKNEVRKIIR